MVAFGKQSLGIFSASVFCCIYTLLSGPQYQVVALLLPEGVDCLFLVAQLYLQVKIGWCRGHKQSLWQEQEKRTSRELLLRDQGTHTVDHPHQSKINGNRPQKKFC